MIVLLVYPEKISCELLRSVHDLDLDDEPDMDLVIYINNDIDDPCP